ncbi:MAG: hypothetical protein HWQ35_05705 [Nostoc sp. NMS1]|uniref:hypothetical protein n=1 Tax=Nostoc sp. NMS1 TaxID=2815388 RepID=UPI0025D86715|nr:hypothetical protein [Nostoc sp. NMS1]MBN3906057.1 hypothetical protein [Nostoc sp. NMS1]
MDQFELFTRSVVQDMTKTEYEYISSTIEEKLDLNGFLIQRMYFYQRSSLYKDALNNFCRGGEGSDISATQFNQLALHFRSERWKIFYEFGLWCVNTYKDNPHSFHEEAGLEFVCKAIGCLTASDSPIKLTAQEKNYATFRLILNVYNMSPKMGNSTVVSFFSMFGMIEEVNKLNSLSNPIH